MSNAKGTFTVDKAGYWSAMQNQGIFEIIEFMYNIKIVLDDNEVDNFDGTYSIRFTLENNSKDDTVEYLDSVCEGAMRDKCITLSYILAD